MTDENIASENGKGSPILPPKISEQLGTDILSAAVKAREFGLRETGPSRSSKQKLKVRAALWLLILISAVVLTIFFFNELITDGLNHPAGRRPEIKPHPSTTPFLPIKPRVNVSIPTDEEVDSAPVLPMKPRISASTSAPADLDADVPASRKPRS